jgi:serine/threonine protein kinase
MADRAGQVVGKYRLIRKLGTGGFAEVYLGEHVQLGTQAAIKLLHNSLMSATEIEQFRQEARTIANLTHPHIVRVLDFDALSGMPYLVMDYAPGGPLRQKYPTGTILPLFLVLPHVQQIAQGLQYAHDRKIVHRDVKPQNLLIGRSEEMLISDFGISVVAETTSRQQSQGFAGTLAYAAPEQIQGHPRPESDQYSLAMIVYEWLTGAPAFTGSMIEVMWKQVNTPPPSLRSKVPAIPPAAEQVILKALSKDPRDRYPSIQAFASALTQANTGITNELAVPVPPPPPPPVLVGPVGGALPFSGPAYTPPFSGPPVPPQVSGPTPTPPLNAGPAYTPPSWFTDSVHPSPPPPPPFQAPMPPPTPDRRSNRPLTILLITLLVVILIGGSATAYAIVRSHSGPISQVPTPIPTSTSVPTDTPIPPTATPNPSAPYTARTPGPGCDNGGGVWDIGGSSANTQVQCVSGGMQLVQPPNAPYIALVYFEGPRSGYRFPQNYSISSDVTIQAGTSTCVGIETRQPQGSSGGYSFLACRNGSWTIFRYDTQGNAIRITSGTIGSKSSYHLQVAGHGSAQDFSVDGNSLYTLNDSTYTSTAYTGLIVDTGINGPGGTALFSNFVYTPLP